METSQEYEDAINNQSFFCWRLAHNSLYTSSVLKITNLATITNCKVCWIEEDTWIHSLLQFNISKYMWVLMDKELSDLLASLCFSGY